MTRRTKTIPAPQPDQPEPRIYINGTPLKDLAAQHGIPYDTVLARYKRGDSVEKLFRPLSTKTDP